MGTALSCPPPRGPCPTDSGGTALSLPPPGCPWLSLPHSTAWGQSCPYSEAGRWPLLLGSPPLSLHCGTTGCPQPSPRGAHAGLAGSGPGPLCFMSPGLIRLGLEERSASWLRSGCLGCAGVSPPPWGHPSRSPRSLCSPREGASQQHPGQRSLGQKPGCLAGEWGRGMTSHPVRWPWQWESCWGAPRHDFEAPFPSTQGFGLSFPDLGEIQAKPRWPCSRNGSLSCFPACKRVPCPWGCRGWGVPGCDTSSCPRAGVGLPDHALQPGGAAGEHRCLPGHQTPHPARCPAGDPSCRGTPPHRCLTGGRRHPPDTAPGEPLPPLPPPPICTQACGEGHAAVTLS